MRIKGILSISLLAILLLGAKHIGPKYDTKPRYALDLFGKNLAKEHHLKLLNTATGGIADAKEGVWALNLVSRQSLTLKEGQQLARKLSKELYTKVKQDPLFAKYCKVAYGHTGDTSVKKEYIAIRLAFWDQEMNRPKSPYLAQIRLADGYLYYHFADPKTQALLPPTKEPFQP